MSPAYKPEQELGQMLFGQPPLELAASDELEHALGTLRELWYDLRTDDNPFSNTGASYVRPILEVHAYSWDEETEQPFNLKWRDLRVSWYKHCTRGVSCNRNPGRKEIRELISEATACFLEPPW